MVYNFTGVQHLKTGDITIPLSSFEKEDDYLSKYHQEMSYALANNNFNGLTIIVFDNAGEIVMYENWIRNIPVPPPEIIVEETQDPEEMDPEYQESEDPESEE